MNINKINKNIAAKNSRNPRPFATFFDISESTSKAMAEVSSLSVSDETLVTLKNNQIINMVTAVEVYFRDILDAIFKMCERESFEGKLKKLHDKNYKIDEVIAIYENKIHPLELISTSLGFQNTDNINKVFSTLLGDRFIPNLLKLKWKLAKDSDEEASKLYMSDVENLQELFDIRHHLIHNPHKMSTIPDEKIEVLFESMYGFILASDFAFTEFINANSKSVEIKDREPVLVK
ncbi:hypothetical protein CWO08_12380 [Vibrio sp. 10N.286.48.B8]|uniref:hypothetical protein n=1 Tax=Vibrio sp. 10N.286.48.B8 TaxID=2056189 RepID=UPI000D3619FC|nr:hypothetical protein [Vibrio sp. 10N.286.48.B8]PTO95124.1 hypothetical protein CWO08_12380 [Vibrio sp. 10N.286.48.B8]